MVINSKEDRVEIEIQGHKATMVEVKVLVYKKWKNLKHVEINTTIIKMCLDIVLC